MANTPQTQVPADAAEVPAEPAPQVEVATPQAAPAVAPASKAPAQPAPVDNSAAVAEEVDPNSVPQQEMADADLPRSIAPGAMGAERALLMQLLGLDVNHPFDEYVEEQIRERVPDYTGVVDKGIWRELHKENAVA